MMLFSDLSEITGGTATIMEDGEVARFSTDSRTLSGRPDEVFIASEGRRDGHHFIEQAAAKGIRNFIVEKDILAEGCNVLRVDNSIRAFQKIARANRLKFAIPIIGITGSNGKTTVKEWLSALLSEEFYVIKNPKSYNSQVGVPISILEITGRHEIGVFEAGISQVSEMEKLEPIIQPTLGVFTTLGQAHDDGFSSWQEKLSEKLRLFSRSEKVICRSDTAYHGHIQEGLSNRLLTWSLDESGKIHVSWDSGKIKIEGQEFKSDFSNAIDLENVTHAIVVALEFGVSPEKIQKGLNQLKPLPMRLELKKGINGCYVLDDSYNNDLMGLRVALEYSQSHKQNTKRTLILSDILQSGRTDQELYTAVSGLLSERNIHRLVGIGPGISSCKSLFEVEKEFYNSTDEFLQKIPPFEKEMIIIKGARQFELDKIAKVLQEKNHGTILEVNFEALQHNLNAYRKILHPSTQLMVMVKANAYGSGILEVANFLQHEKVDRLGVAYTDEAIRLRKNGIDLPIMIMNPYVESFSEFEKYNLEAEVYSLKYLHRLLSDTDQKLAIHLKIDTGMHRLGFSQHEIPELLQTLKSNTKLKVIGIFTHFSSSDDPNEDKFTSFQAAQFDEAYDQISEALGYAPIKHASNSPAMVRRPEFHYDMVRLGIGLHGFDPTNTLHLRSSSQLKTVISQIQSLKKGDTVGYSRKGTITKDSRIAVLPLGYADGFSRVFGNGNANVLIDNKLCPTVGNVCMDMTMVDVSDTNASEGDEVVVFGTKPSVGDLAKQANTIPYEILTNISSRVKRVFVSE